MTDPELAKALDLARRTGAQLLVAKLDRLSRDVEFIARTMKHVDIKVATMPNADPFPDAFVRCACQEERQNMSQQRQSRPGRSKEQGDPVAQALRMVASTSRLLPWRTGRG